MIAEKKVKAILFGLAYGLKLKIRKNEMFRDLVSREDFTAQIKLMNGGIGRWYRFKGGKVTSQAGIETSADFTIGVKSLAAM